MECMHFHPIAISYRSKTFFSLFFSLFFSFSFSFSFSFFISFAYSRAHSLTPLLLTHSLFLFLFMLLFTDTSSSPFFLAFSNSFIHHSVFSSSSSIHPSASCQLPCRSFHFLQLSYVYMLSGLRLFSTQSALHSLLFFPISTLPHFVFQPKSYHSFSPTLTSIFFEISRYSCSLYHLIPSITICCILTGLFFTSLFSLLFYILLFYSGELFSFLLPSSHISSNFTSLLSKKKLLFFFPPGHLFSLRQSFSRFLPASSRQLPPYSLPQPSFKPLHPPLCFLLQLLSVQFSYRVSWRSAVIQFHLRYLSSSLSINSLSFHPQIFTLSQHRPYQPVE